MLLSTVMGIVLFNAWESELPDTVEGGDWIIQNTVNGSKIKYVKMVKYNYSRLSENGCVKKKKVCFLYIFSTSIVQSAPAYLLGNSSITPRTNLE